jgi:hypothetical protein
VRDRNVIPSDAQGHIRAVMAACLHISGLVGVDVDMARIVYDISVPGGIPIDNSWKSWHPKPARSRESGREIGAGGKERPTLGEFLVRLYSRTGDSNLRYVSGLPRQRLAKMQDFSPRHGWAARASPYQGGSLNAVGCELHVSKTLSIDTLVIFVQSLPE